MSWKLYKLKASAGKLRQAGVLHNQGMSMADSIRQLRVSEVTDCH